MYKCVAVDDDKMYLNLLQTFFAEIPEAELIAVYDNPVKAALGLMRIQPDILLLDYGLPYIDGFEMLSMLQDPPKVIVISGYLKDPDESRIPAEKFIAKGDLKTPRQLEQAIREVMHAG